MLSLLFCFFYVLSCLFDYNGTFQNSCCGFINRCDSSIVVNLLALSLWFFLLLWIFFHYRCDSFYCCKSSSIVIASDHRRWEFGWKRWPNIKRQALPPTSTCLFAASLSNPDLLTVMNLSSISSPSFLLIDKTSGRTLFEQEGTYNPWPLLINWIIKTKCSLCCEALV